MTYGLYTTPAGERALRKLYPKVREHLLKELQTLKANPYLGKQLDESRFTPQNKSGRWRVNR